MKVAGIDVQESVDGSCRRCECAGRETSAAAICHHAERVAPTVDLATGTGGRRGGDGIDRSVLAVGVAGTGAPYAFAFKLSSFSTAAAKKKKKGGQARGEKCRFELHKWAVKSNRLGR